MPIAMAQAIAANRTNLTIRIAHRRGGARGAFFRAEGATFPMRLLDGRGEAPTCLRRLDVDVPASAAAEGALSGAPSLSRSVFPADEGEG
jgi:hypothetical protein